MWAWRSQGELDIPVRAFITQAVGLGSRRLSSLDDWAGGRNFDLPLGFLGAASHVVFKDREGFYGRGSGCSGLAPCQR